MANTLRKTTEEHAQKPLPKQHNTPKSDTDKGEMKGKTVNPTIKKKVNAFKRIFQYIFAGKVLQRLELKKNLRFICFVAILIVLVIYNNLLFNTKSKKVQQLNEEITFSKDEVMNLKEESFNIDIKTGTTIDAELEGFNPSGYIPFIISDVVNTQEN